LDCRSIDNQFVQPFAKWVAKIVKFLFNKKEIQKTFSTGGKPFAAATKIVLSPPVLIRYKFLLIPAQLNLLHASTFTAQTLESATHQPFRTNRYWAGQTRAFPASLLLQSVMIIPHKTIKKIASS